MSKRKPEYYDAGVYQFRNRLTNDSYVGASVNLEQRINQRMALIRNGAYYSTDERFAKAFEGCKADDIEVRIIERVQVPTCEKPKRRWSSTRKPKVETPGLDQLRDREIHWIKTIRPSLNKNHMLDRIKISTLPVGPPEEITVQA